MSNTESLFVLTFSLSIINLILLALFVWLFLSGKLKIRTKKLIVIDQNKIERIHLDSQSSDVRIFGKNFKRQSPASGLVLFNSKGDETGGFATLEDGTTSLTIDSYEANKVSERASMFVMKDGNAGFIIKDIDNQIRMKAELSLNNKIEFKIFDKTEKEQKSFSFE